MLEPVRRAIHDAIADNPARLKGEAIAARMLMSKSTLYAYGETDAEGEARKSIPLERFVQFTLVTEDGRALKELCALAGYAAIRLPAKGELGGETAALEAIRDFSAFMTTNAQSLVDDTIDPDELASIEKRADVTQRAIAQVVAYARRKLEESKR